MIEITEEQREVLKLAIEIYGEKNQIDKCIEEMAELTQALLKHRHRLYRREGTAEIYCNLIEEIADVSIMLEQMVMIYVEEPVREEINEKIKRLAQRLYKEV